MTTQANYILKAVVGGETYLFEYHDTVNVWDTLEDFWHDDYPEVLAHLKDCGLFPIEVQAMESGRVITTYRLQFGCCVFDHFFDKGWKAGCDPYTLDEFIKDINIREMKEEPEEKTLTSNP